MFIFPDYSDLGNVSGATRMTWENELANYSRYHEYFNGDVFKQEVPVEVSLEGADEPLLFPVGINLVKTLCMSQADALFGEWEDQILKFGVKQDDDADDASLNAVSLLGDIMTRSNANAVLWEVALDRELYGGGVIKVSPVLSSSGHIKWVRVPVQNFYPIFNPEDPDQLLEVYIAIPMSSEQAKIMYGYDKGTPEAVMRVEHWTRGLYETTLNGKRVDAYTGVNPWGIVPFVYVPRFRSDSVYGDPLTPDIIPAQDEINMRVADIGEAINYNAHPIRWGLNMPKAFNTKHFPLAPNAFWDLGRRIGQSPEPQVGLLEAQHAVNPEAFTQVNFLYDWVRTGNFVPPIALGDDEGGGQRSGITLEIRMWSLIKAIRRSRSYMLGGLRQVMDITAKILKQKSFNDVSVRSLERILRGDIVPYMAEILPRDHVATVDEVVKLLSTDPPGISIETSQKILGRGSGEVQRILSMIKDKKLWKEMEESNDVKEGIKGEATPQTKSE